MFFFFFGLLFIVMVAVTVQSEGSDFEPEAPDPTPEDDFYPLEAVELDEDGPSAEPQPDAKADSLAAVLTALIRQLDDVQQEARGVQNGLQAVRQKLDRAIFRAERALSRLHGDNQP